MSNDLQHWEGMALAWEHAGSPLRPATEDVEVFQRFANEWIERRRVPRVLLLGVTPELYRLAWPEGRDFVAVDRTPTMIERVWPGRADEVVRAGWLDLPLPPASRDLALCDGGLHLLDYPRGQQTLADRLHAVVAPGGRVILRLFVPPENPESAEEVLADLSAGRIANLNLLKLRLGMALQGSPESGVAVKSVWAALHEAVPDREGLARRLGWSAEQLATIDAYRESAARYHFVSLEQATALFCADGRFVFRGHHRPAYVLGERCPLVVFERQ